MLNEIHMKVVKEIYTTTPPNAAIICAGSGSLVLYLLTILDIYLIDLK